MSLEVFTLDGLSLTNGSPFEIADTPEFVPAPLRAEWVGGPDVDGAALLEDPHADNCVFTIPLRISQQTTADLAAGYLGDLLDKLGGASRNGSDGIDLVWTPKDWTRSFTATVLLGEVIGLPLDSRGVQMGWLVRSPVLTVRLTCKPFLYGDWLDTITDAFGSNTIANYTLDAGAGTLSISGGVLVPSSTSDKYLIHTSSPYAMEDSRVLAKVTTGASVASGIAGVVLKRLDASNMLFAQVTFAGTSSVVRVAKIDAGSISTLSSSSVFTPTTATNYWVRGRQEGNVITAEVFTAVPTATLAATRSISHTLTGGDVTKFGTGVTGRTGIRFNPQATDWRMDDFSAEPNVVVSTSSAVPLLMSGVLGDVSAEGKLTVTDSAGQTRRHLEVGIDPEYNDAASPSTPHLITEASLITSGFAGLPATLALVPTAAFGTGTSFTGHVGAWRVKLLGAQVSSTGVQVRLAYRSGDGQYSFTPWIYPPVVGAETEIDFGVITLAKQALGTQVWDGRVEAVSTTVGDTFDLVNVNSAVLMLPVTSGYVKARAPIVDRAGVLVGRDEFTAITAATALNARTAPAGGSWATSGATTDFAAADGPVTGNETESRAAVSDTGNGRIAVLGSAALTDTDISIDYYASANTSVGFAWGGVIARYVDASNFLRAYITVGMANLLIVKRVAAGETSLVAISVPLIQPTTWYTVRVVVMSSGVGYATVSTTAGGLLLGRADFFDATLATGGALDDGKPGFFDFNTGTTAVTRYYDNFVAATPAAESRVIESGRKTILTHDSALKESSAGGVYGELQPRGARLFVPPAGDDARKSRIIVKARRVDVDTSSDTNLADSTTLQLSYRPRYRMPRA